MADKVHHIKNLAELKALFASTTYVAVDFTAAWCGPCKAVAPHYSKFSTDHSIDKLLAFAKVDVDEARDVAAQYGISAMPTFLFFKDGQRVAVNGEDQIKGAMMLQLNAAVQKLSGLAKAKAEAASL